MITATTIAVVSNKGGTGKTSMVQNVGAELASRNHRVLLVDMDSQANLTMSWGLDPSERRRTVYDALVDPSTIKRTIVAVRPDLSLLPASMDLAGAELHFATDTERNHRLSLALRTVAHLYDYLLIDTPPSLGFLTTNALMSANEVIITLQCQFYALKSIGATLDIVAQAARVNRGLHVRAIVPTMFDARTSLSQPVLDAARQAHGNLVTQTVIPVNVRVADAPITACRCESTTQYRAVQRHIADYQRSCSMAKRPKTTAEVLQAKPAGWQDQIAERRATPEEAAPDERTAKLSRKTYLMTDELVEEVEAFAAKYGVGLNEAHRFLVIAGLEAIRTGTVKVQPRTIVKHTLGV